MREILFRGKPTPNYEHWKIFRPDLFSGDFIYGSLNVCGNRYYISTHAMCSINSCVNNGTTTMVEVIPETVGQFINDLDMNNVKIYEGDVVKCCGKFNKDTDPYLIVVGHRNGACGICVDTGLGRWMPWGHDLKIIGNIYDNPELLGDAAIRHMKFYEFGCGKDVTDYNYHQKRIADGYSVDLAQAGCYLVNYENEYICHTFNGGCESCNVCRRIHEGEANKKEEVE